MLPALLIIAAIASASPTVRDDVEHRPALELSLHEHGRRLVLRNTSAEPELVILRDVERGTHATLLLPARGETSMRCSLSELAGCEVTLVERDSNGVHFSPALPLARLVGVRGRALELGLCGTHRHAIEGALDSSSVHAPLPLSAPAGPARHVPVITPDEGQRGDLPPRLESKPLPAV